MIPTGDYPDYMLGQDYLHGQAPLPQRAARSDGLVANRNQQPPISPPPQTNLSMLGAPGSSGRRPGNEMPRTSFANELDLANLDALQAAELNLSTLASLGDPFANIPEVRPLQWDMAGGNPTEVPQRVSAAAQKTKNQKGVRPGAPGQGVNPRQGAAPRTPQHPGYGTTPAYGSVTSPGLSAALEAQVRPLSDVQQQARLAAAAAAGLNDMEALMNDVGGFIRPPPGLPPGHNALPPGIWDGLGQLPLGAFGPPDVPFSSGLPSAAQAPHPSDVRVDPFQGGYARSAGLGPPGCLDRLGGKGGDSSLGRSVFGEGIPLPGDMRGLRGARNGLDADDDGLVWASSMPKR